MPGSDPVTHMLDVPGARLYYERRGTGLLLLIGSPMDSTGFAGLASVLAGRYTVVTYDPRGIGNSTRKDTTSDVTPGQQADDVHRLLAALGGAPADIFGSSGGAVVGLALVTAHPGRVRTLVAHEPPVIELLPDSAQLRAEVQDILRHLPGRPGRPGDGQIHGPRRRGQPGRLRRRRAAVGTVTGADRPDARQPATSSPTWSARPRATGRRSPALGGHRCGSWSPPGPRRGAGRQPRRGGPRRPARHACGRVPR